MEDTQSTPKNPYIYKVTDLETGQYYIGSQCRGLTIGVNYFTSSTNKEFMEGFKNYGEEKYKIEIVGKFTDPEECVNTENYMIRDHMLLKDGLCLNRFYCCNGKKIFSTVGMHHSEEVRKRISISLRGRNKGTHLTEETKQKLSLAHKGRPSPHKGIHHSEETKQKLSLAHKGRPSPHKGIHHSEEIRKRMSEVRQGTHLTEETKQKLSTAMKGRPAQNRIKISIEGRVFSSITEASKYYNVTLSTISRWAQKNQHNAFYIKK